MGHKAFLIWMYYVVRNKLQNVDSWERLGYWICILVIHIAEQVYFKLEGHSELLQCIYKERGDEGVLNQEPRDSHWIG